ncbi:ricin-type beta-trefoil lectin domain protein [Kitasatospora sp. NPDC058965]|uniref:ricin-type beta-trefoil lectin domain protein n=1 Tax=Kitasatospora sp. NPDC058965 TaxID=3346682 RepID=UPI0036CAE4E3
MPRPASRPSSRHRTGRPLTVGAALATALAFAAGPALAHPTVPVASVGAAAAPSSPTDLARAQAKKTGKPVTVDALTTETAVTVANPDGKTFTRTSNIQPVRVQKGGAWVATDATLAKNADGTFSPAATPSGVTLSGGGTAPLAAFKDKAGHQFSMALPFALPKPTVNGDTATYAEVLPGVDLQATVTDQGAFHEVLVVKNAQAAANPQLKTLKLATSTNGLTTSTDADGNLTMKAPDGTVAFHAPTPVMWDSAALAAPGGVPAQADAAAAEAAPKARAISPAAPPAPPSAVDPAGRVGSSKDGPGHGAHISTLKVTADGGSVTLAPDADQLAHASYPLFIDPTVAPGGGTNHYLEVKEGCAGQSLYDNAQENGEGVGYQQYDSNCFGLYRSFYEMDTSFFNSSMIITKSTMTLAETYGADHGCNNTWGIGLRLTGGIANGTNWNTQPGQVQDLGQTTVKSAYSGCGTQYVNFDVTGPVGQYRGYNNLTFGIYGQENKYATNYGFMRFSTNPQLSTQYEIAPNMPDTVSLSQGSCGGWLGATVSGVTLNSHLSSGMPGVNLHAGTYLQDDSADDGHGNPYVDGYSTSPTVGNPGGVSSPSPVGFADGHTYEWSEWANDGYMDGPHTSPCVFTVDSTAPTLTVNPSTAFPALGSGKTPTGHAGDTLTLQVTAKDPVPTWACTRAASPCRASGVAGFHYALDAGIPANGAQSTGVTGTSTDGTANGTVTVTLPANQWGTHTLFVAAYDNAGNSTTQSYSFYAPWNPAAKVATGDVDGDGVPDLVTAGSNGNLYVVPGNADPGYLPTPASTPATSPEPGHGWDTYLLAHGGSLTQSGLDDLYAYSKTSKQLYTYANDATATPAGTPGHFSLTQGVSPVTSRPGCQANGTVDCTNYPKDWSLVQQMISPGTLSTAANQAANPGQFVAQSPDLITVENNQLWYYVSGFNPAKGHLSSAYPLGTGDWSKTTLVGVGRTGGTPTTITVPGDGFANPPVPAHSYTDMTGGTPVLWVRNNTTGAVTSYPLAFDANGLPAGTLTAPVSGALPSALTNAGGSPVCLDDRDGAVDGAFVRVVAPCVADAASQAVTYGTDNTVHLAGKCLDVSNGATAAGTKVQLSSCTNGPGQQWTPGSGPGSLVNTKSGLCLDDPAGSTDGTVQLQIWTCGGGPNQNWASGTTLPAQQPVLNIGLPSGLYPTVNSPGDVNGDGTPDLYAVSSTGQLWEYPGSSPKGSLAQVGSPVLIGTLSTATVGPGPYLLYNTVTTKCADLPNYGPGSLGTPVAEYTCNGTSSDNQLFYWDNHGTTADGYSQYTIRNAKDNLCLDVHDLGVVEVGAPVSEYTCNGTSGDNQLYKLVPRPGGASWIVNVKSGLCLDVNGVRTGGNDAPLTLYTCSDLDDHTWLLQ